MNKNKYIPWIVAAGAFATLALALPVFAATSNNMPMTRGGFGGHFGPGPAMAPGVFGTVTAINGDSLTVTSQMFRPRNTTSTAATTTTVYTVDATNAQVIKNGASSTIASIATGDMIFAQGTVSGTNVTATVIRDGIMGMGMMGKGGFGRGMGRPTSTPPVSPIQGNGEPVVGGSITVISGTTLTVTNTSNVTYTIDATNATIIKNGTSTAITNLATGDNVIVQGTVNGTSVTASSVIDQGNGTHATSTKPMGGQGFGIFSAIGSFFKRIFGF